MTDAGLARSLQAALRDAAERWLAQDPDETTRAELQRILDRAGAVGDAVEDADESDRAEAWRELRDRFGTRLAFGTAGLRGRQGAGSNRMNRVLVAQAARGFADFLLARAGRAAGAEGAADATGDVAAADAARPSIVIGYDARINSDVYARDTAELMQAAGVRAMLLPRALPTPVLAFAVRHLDASAGVMVTASHNPKWDNGYKVYLGDDDQGSQIVPPVDGEIAAAIEAVANGSLVSELPRSSDYALADESLLDAYVDATAAVFRGDVASLDGLTVVYTPFHGVGWETYRRVLERLGLGEPTLVEAQLAPDGSFPTLDFPNPEEEGALDLAYAAADAVGADVIIAHDPDADRLAVAVPVADASAEGGRAWRRFGGNDIGKLLGWRAAENAKADGVTGSLATSLVSSPALSRVAEAYGLDYAQTPTGFKWISRAPGILFGYEEALGYLVDPAKVRDKDGVSAAIAILDLAGRMAAEGRTLNDLDDEFAERFGAFASTQVAIRYDDPAQLPRVMAEFRANPPALVGTVAVSRFDDLATGVDGIPPIDILRVQLADGTRLMIRPSGTEPKLKVYIDATSAEGTTAERAAAAEAAARAAAAGVRELLA